MYVCMYVCMYRQQPLFHSSNPVTHPELYFSQQSFPSKDILLVPHFPVSKIQLKNRYFEEQICWVPLTVGTFRMSNSLPTCASLGLMPVGSSPPILGQTIYRCISTPINGWGGPTRTGGQMMLTCLFYLCLLY